MKVKLIGFMQVNPDYIYDYDWQVQVESEPEWIAASAMRSCRTEKAFHDIMNENNSVPCPVCKGVEDLVDECFFCEGVGTVSIISKRIYDSLLMGHYTVAGMTDFIFLIQGMSRSATHQIVRHRTPWFLQQSQRAVSPIKGTKWYVVPPKIAQKPKALIEFIAVMDRCKEGYKNLRKMKIPLEDCRSVLPNATKSNIIMKIDGSNLLHFLKLRTHPTAQWEIRAVANAVHREVKKVCPTIFKDELQEFWW